ncbi:replication protein A 70 kDa DNA-binding subunit A-like [Arachis hypogaea]|uniref:replication protein A 70 kDa DNA-binding subunit A-like n=1 Tax=Arachis hypogaea TaxID=3818 RepID=UPI000DEC37B6
MAESYDFVEDVNAKKLAWSFKVHVIRIYEVSNRFNLKELNSIEMVLQDSKGGRIQASIPKSLVKKWRGVIIEFQMYTMSNFIVIKEINPMKRVIPGTWVFTFSHRTRVDHVVNTSFPLQPFRFRTIPHLINAGSLVDNDLFDLIGEIVGKEEPKYLITNKGKETRRLAVVLQDLENNRINCVLFGGMVDQILPHFEEGRMEPLIVVLQYFRATRWKEKTSVQSHFDVSKLHIDDQLADVVGVPKQEGPTWIVGSIVSINAGNSDWFYKAYRKCPKKVETPIGNRYKCSKCSHTHRTTAIRFKVEVMVYDGTGSMTLLLWDREITQLCGKAADNIMEKEESGGDEYLATFDAMMDRKLLFKINENGCSNSIDTSANVVNLNTDTDPQLSMDLVEEYVDSIKSKTLAKRTPGCLKSAPLILNDIDEEGQFSNNKVSKKGDKR